MFVQSRASVEAPPAGRSPRTTYSQARLRGADNASESLGSDRLVQSDEPSLIETAMAAA
jgi:hypothetical protein